MSYSFQKEKKIFRIPSIRRTVHVRQTKAIIVKNILMLVIVAQSFFLLLSIILVIKAMALHVFIFFF